jgi:hypothetical protein
MAAHEPMSIGGSADVRVAPEKLESVPECPWHASLAIPAAKVPLGGGCGSGCAARWSHHANTVSFAGHRHQHCFPVETHVCPIAIAINKPAYR